MLPCREHRSKLPKGLVEVEATQTVNPEVPRLMDLERDFFVQPVRVRDAGMLPIARYRRALL